MGKHLTLDERTIIQVSLGEGKTLGEIAKTLGKATSTISREVRNHAVTVRKGAYGYVLNECVHRHHCRENGICISKPDCVTKNCRFCKECNSNCSKFEREVCSKLSTPPYVCNGCPQKPKCTLEKRMYDAKLAVQHSSKRCIRCNIQGYSYRQRLRIFESGCYRILWRN